MKSEIKSIHQRNLEKDLDKAWETSWTRKLSIAFITYLTALLLLSTIEVPNAFLAALVPTGGFLLSTCALNPLKKVWLQYQSD